MKKYINYYYNLEVNDFVFKNGKYFFTSDGQKYQFKIYDNANIQFYYDELKMELNKYKYFFEIVPNIENKLITVINNKPYVLLKNNIYFYDDDISMFDIRTDLFINSNTSFLCLKRFPWTEFWENKIDYLENWIIEKKNKYKKFYSILNYFLGVSENALLYLKEAIKNQHFELIDRLYIQHDRMNIDYTLFDYYDPTLVILDHPSRDVCEYIKSAMLYGRFDINDFENYIKKKEFSKYDIMIMYSRLLFPSFFYDYFENFIIKKSSTIILDLEDKIQNFQLFLSQISRLFYDKYGIEYPKWISKINH